MGLSPAVILYDADGNAVSIVSDSGVRRLSGITKLLDAAGTQINPTKEETLAAIKDTAGVKKITDALPAGTNLLGKVQLRNPGNTVDLGDASNPIRSDPTGTTTQPISAAALPLPAGASTEATLLAADGRLTTIDAVLDAIKDVDGIKKITDPVAVTTAPEGSTPGISIGTVTTTATTPVPIRSTTYNEQSSGAQRSVASSSANDTAAGTGARTLRITYYTSAGLGPYFADVTLNGTTPVNTTPTDICFIESMKVLTVGSTGSNAGTITLYVSTGGGGGTIGTIAATENRTFWAHHYIPSGKTCHVTTMDGHNNNSSNGTVLTLRSREFSVNAPWIIESPFVRVGGASGQVTRPYGTPIAVDGPKALVLYGAPEGTPSIITRASFDFYDQ